MSVNAGLLSSYRSTVLEDVQGLLDTLDFAHATLLREAWSGADDGLVAPSLCLLTADAISGDPAPARPLATALALLEASASLFRNLVMDEERLATALQTTWGMPRVLNAGDAFFVLAQQAVLKLREPAVDAKHVLDAASRFDAIAARVWYSLAANEPATPALITGAIVLGAVAATPAPNEASIDITGLQSIETVIAALDLSDESKQRLLDAARQAPESA